MEAHPSARLDFLAANKKILEKEAEEARKKQSESIESTGISEEFFTSNQSLAEEFAAFVRKAAKNSEVVKFLKRIVQYENSTQLTPGTILELFAGLDMLKVSERLGHPFDKDSLASFPFIAVSLGFNDHKLDYWDFSNQTEHFYQEMGDIYYNAVMKGVGMNKDADVDYFGLYIFRSSGYDHEEDYLRFMYRFASLVAKANGNISTEEATILKEIQSQINEICNQKNTAETQQVQTEDKKKQTALQQAEPAKPALEQLDELIGLEGVKAEIHKLHNYVKIQRKREACGMQSVPLAVHCVFTGNPGTGKTTVARILAEIFKDLGLLKKGHLVETDRSGLVAEYVGQTAVKTNKIIDSALDGVLFIDEAYTLASGGSNDYGHEAVATLLKRMEDNRDRLIVIIAGYKDEMQKFIDMNPGLQSRFTRYINFEDYNALALARIFHLNAKRYGYTLSPDADRQLNTVLTDMVLHKDEHFGNAREVRNLFEQTLQHQADRLIGIENVSEHDLSTIEAEDIVK
ncbi:MAG: AAA family ATPase [Bacteroidales bacterium]|nr:AAA family ATPase [Bacteroidales bacterium]